MTNLYFVLTGIAFQKGLEAFEQVMPKSRVFDLYTSCLRTKGFKWCEDGKFIHWILAVAAREERAK